MPGSILADVRACGVDFFVSVPCRLLGDMLEELEADGQVTHFPVTREEEGIGVCVGAFLGGASPCILMQNTGLGNSVGALVSLVGLYDVPLVLLLSYRGTPGESVAAQAPMARITRGLLDMLGIPTLHCHEAHHAAEVPEMVRHARVTQHPVAILFDFNFVKEAGR